ncbi:MAG: TIGR00303 family protein [Crenarchaeota archaeon]|nr:TIGR00303 family protein [Thermoproteota archaeon]
MAAAFDPINNPEGCHLIAVEVASRKLCLLYFIASTKTSTIPGISVAGATPEKTLWTPALDVEYLVLGMPRSAKEIPVTPEGLPTPAVITRAAASLLDDPLMVVDAGSFIDPRIPHIDLPSKTVGGRIDIEPALPKGRSRELFEDAKLLASMALPRSCAVLVGESMPGGTTTAMAIMEALGYRARDKVSSASPANPLELKWKVVSKALERARGLENVFDVLDEVGDPLHVSIAGFVAGAVEKGCVTVLAGGTQMCAVLAILKRLGVEYRGKLAIWTTRWIVKDKQSDILGLVREIDPSVPLAAARISFERSEFEGLRMYEKGYVKEGVGAGGTAIAAMVRMGVDEESLVKVIEREYRRLLEAKVVEDKGAQ